MNTHAAAMPLPAWRHLPGVNQRHDEDAFAAIKAMCADRTSDDTAADNIAWHYGLRLIDEGFFWEAHEVLEEVWRLAPPNSRERKLVQCVIHLANGALKRELGSVQAIQRLASLADECRLAAFARLNGPLMGLDDDVLALCCRRLTDGQHLPLLR